MEQLEQILVCQTTNCLIAIFITKRVGVHFLHQLAHVILYLMPFIDISFFVSRGLPKSQREKEKASGKDTMRVIHCIKSLYSVHLKYTKIDKSTQLLVLNDLDVLKYDPLFASRLPPLLHPYPTHDMYMKVLSSFGKIFVQILRHFLQF